MSLKENEDRSILSAAGDVKYNTCYRITCVKTLKLCLCEIIPWVLLTYRVDVHWGVARVCPGVQRALPAPDYTPWMPIKGSNTRVSSVYCYHYATLAVNNDDRSNWEWLRDYLSALTMLSDWVFLVLVTFFTAVCRQRPTRNACCGRETTRCRCKIRYVSKCTAASRGSPCDSTALVYVAFCGILFRASTYF